MCRPFRLPADRAILIGVVQAIRQRKGKDEIMADWQRGHRLGAAMALLVMLCAVTGWAAAESQFEVGQKWVYQHQGPRPGNMEPNAIDGQRIRQVLAVNEKQEHPWWIVQETFTNDEDATSLMVVDHERRLTGFEITGEKGETIAMTYETPVPYQVPFLAVGEEKVFETRLLMGPSRIALPTKSVVKRLPDETVATPAGEFVNCQHYHTTSESVLDFKIAKIPMTDERDQWYHESVNGLVKEVYRKGPIKYFTWSCEGYTSTSVLVSFGVEEVTSGVQLAVLGDPNDPNAPHLANVPATVSPVGLLRWVLWGVISVVLVAVVLVVARRPRSQSAPDSNAT
jgi:hypothetical protein